MKSEEIEIRTFGESDLGLAMRLKDLAGWNQTVETVFALLDEMGDKLVGEKIYLDVNAAFGATADELRARGLSKERGLIRMRRGEKSAAGTSGAVFAIAGPEIG